MKKIKNKNQLLQLPDDARDDDYCQIGRWRRYFLKKKKEEEEERKTKKEKKKKGR